jgi:hypothetical protein
VRLLRRRSAEEPSGSDNAGSTGSARTGQAGHSQAQGQASHGKGRPTPRRSQAQGRRTGPVPPPPRTRREAARRQRELGATRRTDTAARVRSGDESALPRRDRGPERQLVRDLIDSRRNAGGAFLVMALLVLVSYAIPSSAFKLVVLYMWIAVFALMAFDSVLIGMRVKRLVAERFPDSKQRTVSLVLYGVNRTILPRRWRLPAARVGRGDEI